MNCMDVVECFFDVVHTLLETVFGTRSHSNLAFGIVGKANVIADRVFTARSLQLVILFTRAEKTHAKMNGQIRGDLHYGRRLFFRESQSSVSPVQEVFLPPGVPISFQSDGRIASAAAVRFVPCPAGDAAGAAAAAAAAVSGTSSNDSPGPIRGPTLGCFLPSEFPGGVFGGCRGESPAAILA